LNPANNPAYPAATVSPEPPNISDALAGDRQVLLLWQGVAFATGYNLKRAAVSGGPYTTITNGLAGASFVDSGLSNGSTYYYILNATNQIGESLSSAEVSATPIPFVGGNLTAKLVPSGLSISWPATYTGWILQTNPVDLSHAGWGDVPDSISRSEMTFPLGFPRPAAQYFRLRHP
jgi:hypothetical protein